MGTYCLIARNKKDNSFKVIGIKESWYKKGECYDFLSYKNSLSAIDLVTTRFISSEQMQKRLIEKGYIIDGEYDFFIVSKTKSGSNNTIKFQEVIYQPEKNERMNEFIEVALASEAGNIKTVNGKVLKIFNKLLTKSYYKGDFYYMIQNGFTGLPKKIVNILEGIRENNTVPYSLKYQERWVLNSYPVIRNIIEALNRYDLFSSENSNINQANVMYFNEKIHNRKSLIKDLEVILDSQFAPGQFSLFDKNIDELWAVFGGVVENKNTVLSSGKVPLKKVKLPKYQEDNVISINKIMKFLIDLPLEIFVYKDNKLVFNYDIFDYEFDESMRKRLDSLLNSHLKNCIHLYLFHKKKFEELSSNSGGYGARVLMEDMEEDLKDIKTNLKSLKELAQVDEWCKLCSTFGGMNDIKLQEEQIGGDALLIKKK